MSTDTIAIPSPFEVLGKINAESNAELVDRTLREISEKFEDEHHLRQKLRFLDDRMEITYSVDVHLNEKEVKDIKKVLEDAKWQVTAIHGSGTVNWTEFKLVYHYPDEAG